MEKIDAIRVVSKYFWKAQVKALVGVVAVVMAAVIVANAVPSTWLSEFWMFGATVALAWVAICEVKLLSHVVKDVARSSQDESLEFVGIYEPSNSQKGFIYKSLLFLVTFLLLPLFLIALFYGFDVSSVPTVVAVWVGGVIGFPAWMAITIGLYNMRARKGLFHEN